MPLEGAVLKSLGLVWVQVVNNALKDFAVMCGKRAKELILAARIHQDSRFDVVMNVA
jgi:hypothetical protein